MGVEHDGFRSAFLCFFYVVVPFFSLLTDGMTQAFGGLLSFFSCCPFFAERIFGASFAFSQGGTWEVFLVDSYSRGLLPGLLCGLSIS